jgi:sarcosine oxidase subunit gamma
MTLSEVTVDKMVAIAPYAGQDKAVAAALKEAFGIGLPGPGRSFAKGGVGLVWFAYGKFLLLGADAPDFAGLAAVTDQADGWAMMRLDGAEAVLARLVPVDLRPATFKKGHAVRTMLGHMTCHILRSGSQAFDIMVMRSMAGTAVHEIEVAMRGVAAR